MTVKWVLDSQQDFSPGIVRNFDQNSGRKSILQFDDREANKLTTAPWLPPAPWTFPSTSHDPQEGEFQIEPGRLNDGNAYTNHYDQTLDGQVQQNGFPVQTKGQFTTINAQRNRNPESVGTGYFACWFKPDWNSGIHYFFDHAKAEYESRATFHYDGRDLVLRICDAGLDQVGQTLRAPYTFEADTWYHVACSWKGVRYGDLVILVDGKSVGTYENYTLLVGDIDERVYQQITVEDVTLLPLNMSGTSDLAKGWYPVIKIDSEAMHVVDIDTSTNPTALQADLEQPPSDPPPAGWTP